MAKYKNDLDINVACSNQLYKFNCHYNKDEGK